MQPEPVPLAEPQPASQASDPQPVPTWQEDWEDWQEVDLLEEEETTQRGGFLRALGLVAVVLLVLLVAVLLWMLAGQMMRLGAIPSLDLGYNWFNAHIYPFF